MAGTYQLLGIVQLQTEVARSRGRGSTTLRDIRVRDLCEGTCFIEELNLCHGRAHWLPPKSLQLNELVELASYARPVPNVLRNRCWRCVGRDDEALLL